jgi:UTP--glucose-1-phosphate uridylyltransferase
MPRKVTKAVIAAAGLGTRFLPMTKAMPKEMLPIIDKPIIQYVVEEAVSAGIEDVIIVGSANKRAIEDHFDHQYELEQKLRKDGKEALAERMEQVAELANFIYLRQKGHYGNGTPVLTAAPLIDKEPFLVLFADDFFRSKVPRAVQLMDAFNKYQAPVISLIPIERDRTKSYGVPDIETEVEEGLFKINGLVEKPDPKDVKDFHGTYFASVGGYILTPEIIGILKEQHPDETGEVYLPVAINELAKTTDVYGRVIDGQWHDAGNKEKYLEAIVDVALADEGVGQEFRSYLKKKIAE